MVEQIHRGRAGIAIREGVYKSFQVTQEHFAEEYGKKIRFFIYNSAQLTEIDRFASDSAINVMIINSQAFNAKGKDARRIYEAGRVPFRRPIDIAKNEPDSDYRRAAVGRRVTDRERLKEFCPLLTLRSPRPIRRTAFITWSIALMRWKRTTSGWSKKIAVKGITGPAAQQPKASSIWKASIFPKQTRQRPFSLTA